MYEVVLTNRVNADHTSKVWTSSKLAQCAIVDRAGYFHNCGLLLHINNYCRSKFCQLKGSAVGNAKVVKFEDLEFEISAQLRKEAKMCSMSAILYQLTLWVLSLCWSLLTWFVQLYQHMWNVVIVLGGDCFHFSSFLVVHVSNPHIRCTAKWHCP